jgi:hypothetical protein
MSNASATPVADSGSDMHFLHGGALSPMRVQHDTDTAKTDGQNEVVIGRAQRAIVLTATLFFKILQPGFPGAFVRSDPRFQSGNSILSEWYGS